MAIGFSIKDYLVKKFIELLKGVFVPEKKGIPSGGNSGNSIIGGNTIKSGHKITIKGNNNTINISYLDSRDEIMDIDTMVDKSIPIQISLNDDSEPVTLWLHCSFYGGPARGSERIALGIYLSCQLENGKTCRFWLGVMENNEKLDPELSIVTSRKEWQAVFGSLLPSDLFGTNTESGGDEYGIPIGCFPSQSVDELQVLTLDILHKLFEQTDRQVKEAMKAAIVAQNAGDKKGSDDAVQKIDDSPKTQKM
jgi:hypothetical protein